MAEVEDKPKVKAFPLQAVTDCLLKELTALAKAEAEIQMIPLPAQPAALTTMKVRLDSLTVVDLVCELEPVLGFDPKDIVRTGGYDSIKAAMDHMVPRVEAAWRRKHPGAA
ncbi:hypothetical protein BH10PSE2_BH10PSE2_11300 [soil metagenome]